MLQINIGRRVGVWVAALTLVAFAAPVALGHTSAAPKLVGSPTAGKTVFTSTCITCHMLKTVSGGGSIGPNLNKVTALDENTTPMTRNSPTTHPNVLTIPLWIIFQR